MLILTPPSSRSEEEEEGAASVCVDLCLRMKGEIKMLKPFLVFFKGVVVIVELRKKMDDFEGLK